MYGVVVLHVKESHYEDILKDVKSSRGIKYDHELNAVELRLIAAEFKKITPYPENVNEQLRSTIEASFSSWFGTKASKYRSIHDVPDNLGTAVTVQGMVYGNLNILSGSGVAFTRNPVNGKFFLLLYDYLAFKDLYYRFQRVLWGISRE